MQEGDIPYSLGHIALPGLAGDFDHVCLSSSTKEVDDGVMMVRGRSRAGVRTNGLVAAEAVSPEQGIQVSTIYNATGGIGAAVASAAVGYLLTLQTVAVQMTTASGTESQLFPAEGTFTWSALVIGFLALVGIGCALSLRSAGAFSTARGDSSAGRRLV